MSTTNLTVKELARIRRCRADTARALAKRKGWPSITRNDGVIVFAVPDEWLTPVHTDEPRDDQEGAEDVVGGETLAKLLDQLQEAQVGRLDAERRAAASDATVTELRVSLAREQQVNDQLRNQVQELLQPWWRKLLKSLGSRG